jgi:hypothetical protein
MQRNLPSAIALGSSHSCGLFASGVYCWGRNDNGQLGDGTTVDSLTAVGVSALSGHTTAAVPALGPGALSCLTLLVLVAAVAPVSRRRDATTA